MRKAFWLTKRKEKTSLLTSALCSKKDLKKYLQISSDFQSRTQKFDKIFYVLEFCSLLKNSYHYLDSSKEVVYGCLQQLKKTHYRHIARAFCVLLKSLLFSYFFLLFLILLSVVFSYQNCPDLRWEKVVLVIEKNFWNSRLKEFWDH